MEIKEENRGEFEMHNGFKQDSISTKYDELSKNYEEVYNSVGWPDPDQCAQLCVDYGYSESSHVLDMGSGTGLVAQYLKDKTGHNNLNVVGIDASEGMIKLAEDKGVYKEIRNYLLCRPTKFAVDHSDLIGKFDFVTASGLLAEGHATSEVFDEMIAVLKRGGYAIFTSRIEYLEPLKYREGMDARVESDKWEFVKKVAYEKYSKAKDTPMGRFKPVMSEVFVYRKL